MDEVLRDVAIGLAVLLLGFAGAVTAILEVLSRPLGWRSGHLWGWVRKTLSGDQPTKLEWIWSPFGGKRPLPTPSSLAEEVRQKLAATDILLRRRIDSLPGKDFARGLAELLLPADGGTGIQAAMSTVQQWPDTVPIKAALLRIMQEASDSSAAFIDRLGDWFDGQMEELTRLYRKNMRWIAAFLGLALAALFNLNAIDAFAYLKEDGSARAISSAAGQKVASICNDKQGEEFDECFRREASDVFSSTELVEWRGLFDSNDRNRRFERGWWPPLGILASGILISFGAPFWRDFLRTVAMRRRPA